jgi:hypothetical protein
VDLASFIDARNQDFIHDAKAQLKDLSPYTSEALEWLMMEHYQFSFRNTKFLAAAAEVAMGFDTDAVNKELERNCSEENGHAVMYKAALKQIGVDVETRKEFPSTTRFLESVGELCLREPSAVLGTMFATETAAIFEHEVFLDVSKEIIARRKAGAMGDPLVYFHDMHLSGVEQSHRDELGVFLRGLDTTQQTAARDGERPTIEPPKAMAGAEQAIAAMRAWWADLFAELRERSRQAAVA